MLTKTNSKISKQTLANEQRINEIQKELLSKTQRLEVFRNYKNNIESKGKVLTTKISSLEHTEEIAHYLQAENNDIKVENSHFQRDNIKLKNEVKLLTNELQKLRRTALIEQEEPDY
mmetsp:Transcript_17401/g.19529  ORF Transcript_17401/g.19529 Transcript_17401/m.19529 type:complete len:117 (+) Transcript_17401:434-784(+)